MSTHCFQLRPFAVIDVLVNLKISSPVVWVGKGWHINVVLHLGYVCVLKKNRKTGNISRVIKFHSQTLTEVFTVVKIHVEVF
jgi:hypothetical protein